MRERPYLVVSRFTSLSFFLVSFPLPSGGSHDLDSTQSVLGPCCRATVLRNAKGAGDDCRVLTLGALILVPT